MNMNSDLRETKQIIYQSKGIGKSYTKTYFFIEFESLCQRLWTFLFKFGHFTMPPHQIWSSHVTHDVDFNFLLLLLYI